MLKDETDVATLRWQPGGALIVDDDLAAVGLIEAGDGA